MPKFYVKSDPEYDVIEFDEVKVKESQLRMREMRKHNRKMPTSVTLAPEVVDELKAIAEKKGIPYQVLMRSFIMEGLERYKKSL